MIRVVLPAHLKNIAHVSGEVRLEVPGPVTQRRVLDALESRYPMLRGTLRDRDSGQRHPDEDHPGGFGVPGHGRVCASTDSTAGRSRTIGAQLSPASADAYTWPPVVPK